MTTRHHQKGDAASTAVYSPCACYRYALTREWAPAAGRVVFVMLNPSTATEVQNDPTVARCERRARALGFGAFRVCNIFAYRATDPRALRWQADPIGPDNDTALLEGAAWADSIICAWGTHGAYLGRGQDAATLLGARATLWHLGLTKAGHPRHPLYLPYTASPQRWG